MKKVIVVGNGMVGYRFCERLRRRVGPDEVAVSVYGEEPRPAYDRVHLSSYFEVGSAEELLLAPRSWYEENRITLHTSVRVVEIDRASKVVRTDCGGEEGYDELVFATGSSPFVPSIPGIDREGVFVYRTLEDLDAIREYGARCRTAAVLGGGLLGLEAAKALLDMGIQTKVVEFMPRLMPRQLDDRSALLLRSKLEALGLEVITGKGAAAVSGDPRTRALEFGDGTSLAIDMLVVSAGIRPRDEVARACGLEIAERGGVQVDDRMVTSDPAIRAIGEVASHRGVTYGLVAPGYDMAEVAAAWIAVAPALAFPMPMASPSNGTSAALPMAPPTVRSEAVATVLPTFEGCDTSTLLKLVGIDVGSFGDPFAEGDALPLVYEDRLKGIYRRINLTPDGKKILGGILIGDAASYGLLHRMCVDELPCPPSPEDLILGVRSGEGGGGAGIGLLPDTAQICSCEGICKGEIENAIRERQLTEVAQVRACTGAGTGCGGCNPLLTELLDRTLAGMGKEVKRVLCEHFAYTRQELFDIVRVRGIRSFDALLDEYGTGDGCEVCKPAAASIVASVFAEIAVEQNAIQDTNDRFLANLQRGGSYSVVPRVPGGEITPFQLQTIGRVAEKYELYTKITGGQRIDLFGARVDQLPQIWEELIAAGFESGHAYGKALRTVKSCVGSSWCRFGVQDSVGFAIAIENRYKGIRAPHKLKSAVSGCIRECAEARSKDFGMIATEKGYNLYVCGNGGANPAHAELLATDLDEASCTRLIDRFLMFYIRTAPPLTRTSTWLSRLEGGIDYLKAVLIEDSLGICAELEAGMEALVGGYRCEWKAVVENPDLRARFSHFVNTPAPDPSISFIPMREQKQPAPWPT